MSNYIRQGLLAFVVLSVAIAGFNIWVDPYNIYRYGSADAQRMSRVDQGLSMRLSKPWQVFQAKATAAVIGSSRSGSIPPTPPSWHGKVGFNLSMAGLTLHEMLRTIEYAQARGPLSDLVIGLEYETFISGDYKTGIGFAEDRLAPAESAGFFRQAIQDSFDTLFTSSGIIRSLMAITRREPITTKYFPDGHWENNSRAWRGEAGYVSVGKNMRRLIGGAPSIYQENLEVFAAILVYCHQQDIDVTLFISPEHLFLTDLRKTIDPSSRWQKFHHDLARLNESIATEQGSTAFALWGFNHLRGIVDEPLPSVDTSPQAWFRDGIHFRKELGQLLIKKMLDAENTPSHALTSRNIDNYLEQVEKLRSEFVAGNPQAISRYQDKIL